MSTEFNELAKEIHQNAKEHGWWGAPTYDGQMTVYPDPAGRNFGEILALIHSEVSEALEAWRDGYPVRTLYREHKDGTGCEYEKACRSPEGVLGEGKPAGVPSELADIIIRVLDACAAYEVDIDAAILAKMAYNRTRPYLHGRVR
jgi:phage baseplate assembly protein gpV